MPGAQPPGRGRGAGQPKIAAERLLLSARWVVPVEPAGAVLEHHAVAVRDGAIEKVLPSSEAAAQFPGYVPVELPEHVLIPGLVNAYTQEPTPRLVRNRTALACAEMLRGGITCFNDAYFFPEAALEAAREAGIRVSLGLIVSDRATAYASDPDDYLRKGLELRDRVGEQPLVSFCLAPGAVTDSALRHVATLAAELDLPVQVRCEAPGELERLRRLGLLGPGLTAVHCVDLQEHEIDLLAEHGCSVAHCPSSDLALARGYAPIEALRTAGANICLGTDSARLDLFTEMRTAALLAKAVARDTAAMPAHAALRAATLGGARALGLGARVGSIEPGKRADLVALSLRAPHADPLSYIVYGAGREDATHAWIDGELRLRDGVLQNSPGCAAGGLDTRAQIWQTLDRQ